MARLVLDTNSLLQCISRESSSHELWLSFLDGRNQLCVTTEILNEYTEVMERMIDAEFAEIIMSIITHSSNTIFINPVYHFKVIDADPDDNKFVDCAVAAKALCIVSDDKHFSHLSKYKFPYVEVLKLADAIDMLFNTKGLA